MKLYESTGFFDKKLLESLFHIFKSDFLVISRLKAEKMNIVIAKGFGASLEVIIIDKIKKEVVWGGSGEFKRGGIYGFGTTQNQAAAEELLRLVFLKL